MANSRIINRLVIGITVVLCVIAAGAMLRLDAGSLVVDLVYAGF